MGGKLSQPNLYAKVDSGQSDQFKYSCVQMQGWQSQMENTSISCLKIQSNSKNANSLFAIFDGVRETFLSVLVNSQAYVQGNYEEALKQSFQKTDQLLFSEKGQKRLQQIRTQNHGEALIANESISDTVGSMAAVILITKKKMYVAHIGDSKIYLMKDKGPLALCQNHKADSFDEKIRVEKAGGQISEGRINGNIQVTRAFGFRSFKNNKSLPSDQQMISCWPEIKAIERNISDKFMFMACDGIWGAHEKKESNLMKKIKQILELNGQNLTQCVKDIINLSTSQSSDQQNDIGTKNMTGLLIKFNQV